MSIDLAAEAAMEYDLIQFVADIGATTRENVQEMHARVCELIAGGMTPEAAIEVLVAELAAKEATP